MLCFSVKVVWQLIDVVVVTRDECKVNKTMIYQCLPVSNLILETSKPLAMARKRAMQKVATEWFVSLDDDIIIDGNWYPTLSQFTTQANVGVVYGFVKVVGLGASFDKSVNETVSRKMEEIYLGTRGLSSNILIRKEAIEDWHPSRPDLDCWEDWEMSQHLLKKGFRWINVSVENCYHIKTWNKSWSNAKMAGKTWKKLYPKYAEWLWRLVRISVYTFRLFFDYIKFKIPWRARIYFAFVEIGELYGLLS